MEGENRKAGADLARRVQVIESQLSAVRYSKKETASTPAAAGGLGLNFVTPTELASGTGSAAWTSVSVSDLVPKSASAIYLQFHADGGGNTVDCLIEYRANSEGDVYSPIDMIPCQSVGDAMANDNAMFLPFDNAKGSFDYQVTAVINPNWRITLIGYL